MILDCPIIDNQHLIIIKKWLLQVILIPFFVNFLNSKFLNVIRLTWKELNAHL